MKACLHDKIFHNMFNFASTQTIEHTFVLLLVYCLSEQHYNIKIELVDFVLNCTPYETRCPQDNIIRTAQWKNPE